MKEQQMSTTQCILWALILVGLTFASGLLGGCDAETEAELSIPSYINQPK